MEVQLAEAMTAKNIYITFQSILHAQLSVTSA